MPRMRIPELNLVTQDLSPRELNNLVYLARACDRPPIDLTAPAPQQEVQSGYATRSDYGDDIDAVIRSTSPQGYAELTNFVQVHDMSNTLEMTRQAEDAHPMPVRSEDRVEYLLGRAATRTLVPQGQYAFGMANTPDPMAATTGGIPCGFIDATGRCGERYHAPTCNSLADPFIAQAVRGQMEQIAARPWADANGQVWHDQEHNAPMSLVDHIEVASGQRLGDVGLFESGRAKRGVAVVQRLARFGDPDADPDEEAWSPVPVGTSRTAARLAAQAGLPTSAGARAQHQAAVREHQRQASRYRAPRHPDYAEFSNSVHQPTELAQFEGSVLGSLPTYSRAGNMSGRDEVLV